MKLKQILCISTLILLISCSKNINFHELGFEKSFQIAKKNFSKEYYLKAIEDCNAIMLNYAGVEGIDSVQFLIGESHFKLGEYYSSSFEYMKLVDSYPESPLTEEALYKSAYCYYKLSPQAVLEQKETKTAISKFQNYLDTYPEGSFVDKAKKLIRELHNRQAEKVYNSGVLYVKMEEPRAAIAYFKSVLDNYYDTDFLIMSYQGLADAYKLMEDEYHSQHYLNKYEENSYKLKKNE